MATVYLATDRKHDRPVAIKLLRAELGAAVGPERFVREIEIAARLQHPHILPLLDSGWVAAGAGQAARPYYVMPYVPGESLRERLERGPLPVAEAVRLLSEIADALATAHGQGVVHRDIKPENVMLSGRHALVMDFGVARAVREASTSARLTSVGFALGTPAYMAPEQAAGDPAVDHRADLYALGIVAFEMLTGRFPYKATTPQQILAAHITQPPEPIAGLRPDLPPGLAEVVMRCLAKEPAARWASAEQLRDALDRLAPAVATPAHGTQPVPAAAVPEETHPVQVALLFGFGGLLFMAAVTALVLRVGLPDWVLTGTQLLLLAGFPLAVGTAVMERRRAAARATGTWHASGETGLQRLMTWRRTRQTALAAFTGLGLAAAAYTAMRLLGIGPLGTLVARGALHAQDRIVVADFTSAGTDSTLGPSVSEALRIDLSQTPVVRVLDATEVRNALRRMARPDGGARLDPATARELALREGGKAYLVGEVTAAGRGFLLTARLLATDGDAELVALRETAADDTEVLAAMDRLSKRLRERLGESLRDLRAAPPMEQVTTSSLEALRLYTEARALMRTGTPRLVEQQLLRAVALDSGFATAWRALGVFYYNTGDPRSKQLHAATVAYQHRERLPDIERLQTEAYYHWAVTEDMVQAERSYRAVLARRPDDITSINNLSLVFARRREWAAAETLLVRGVGVDSTVRSFQVNLVEALAAQHKVDEADAATERMARLVPTAGTVIPGYRWNVRAMRRQWDSAAAVARAALPTLTQPRDREWAFAALSAFAGIRGQVSEMDRLMRAAAAETAADPSSRLKEAVYQAQARTMWGGSVSDGVRLLDQALARDPLATMPAPDRPYTMLVSQYANFGRADRARQLYTQMVADSVMPAGGRQAQYLLGWVEVAEGQYAPGLARIRLNADSAYCANCAGYDLGWAYDRAGERDSVLAVLERVVNAAPDWEQFYDDAINQARAYRRIGELYEERGDRAKALDYYGRLLDQWREADPTLAPVMREVRGRMARLAGEGAL
ncbi:MAG: protein kinase [Gemmatimonadetes bacterium]|nr:protein kinase [Gemmatimonadota bacterium]MBK7715466.1 protein kinase [Gemmatimonadota bacterium]MBK7923247.1 protein kinase [Gemmatimonadota bacterium]MBK9693317.1 protein kinase [Gemmatimonadota bacterium]